MFTTESVYPPNLEVLEYLGRRGESVKGTEKEALAKLVSCVKQEMPTANALIGVSYERYGWKNSKCQAFGKVVVATREKYDYVPVVANCHDLPAGSVIRIHYSSTDFVEVALQGPGAYAGHAEGLRVRILRSPWFEFFQERGCMLVSNIGDRDLQYVNLCDLMEARVDVVAPGMAISLMCDYSSQLIRAQRVELRTKPNPASQKSSRRGLRGILGF